MRRCTAVCARQKPSPHGGRETQSWVHIRWKQKIPQSRHSGKQKQWRHETGSGSAYSSGRDARAEGQQCPPAQPWAPPTDPHRAEARLRPMGSRAARVLRRERQLWCGRRCRGARGRHGGGPLNGDRVLPVPVLCLPGGTRTCTGSLRTPTPPHEDGRPQAGRRGTQIQTQFSPSRARMLRKG